MPAFAGSKPVIDRLKLRKCAVPAADSNIDRIHVELRKNECTPGFHEVLFATSHTPSPAHLQIHNRLNGRQSEYDRAVIVPIHSHLNQPHGENRPQREWADARA